MNPSVENILAGQLNQTERLLWSGQPRGGLRLRSQDILLIPFSILWGGFAIFWELGAVFVVGKAPGPESWIFPLFGLPFVALGFYIMIGRFFVDAKSRERIFYGVTNDRIIIISGIFARQIKSLQLRTLTDVTLSERADRSGSITFGSTNFFGWCYAGNSWPGTGRYSPPMFDMIESAKDVYEIIRAAQSNPSPIAR